MFRGEILLTQIIILLIALGMMFNSAAVLGKPEGNYDAHAKLSSRIVLVISIVIAAFAALSLFNTLTRYWLR